MKADEFLNSQNLHFSIEYFNELHKNIIEEAIEMKNKNGLGAQPNNVGTWMQWTFGVGVSKATKEYTNGKLACVSLIENINGMLEDSILFPEQKAGRFNINFFSNEENEISVKLWFEEDGEKYNILIVRTLFPIEPSEEDKAKIYKNYYGRIFRALFLTRDSEIFTDESSGISMPKQISFQTLVFKGLK